MSLLGSYHQKFRSMISYIHIHLHLKIMRSPSKISCCGAVDIPEGVLPYMGYIGMRGAKGYVFLAGLVLNRVWFVHSSLELVAHYATCFIVWNFKLETLYSFVSYLIKAYTHCL